MKIFTLQIKCLSCALLLSALQGSPAFALETSTSITNESSSVESDSTKKDTLLLAMSLRHFDYSETLPTPLKSTEVGNVPGIVLQYSHENSRARDSWFWGAKLDFSGSNTTYDGSTQSGVPLVSTTSNQFVDPELNLGLTLTRITSRSQLRGYSGVGAHYWKRSTQDYSEVYSLGFVPIGFLIETQPTEKLSVALDSSVRLMFLGNIQVNLTEFDPRLNSPESSLGNRPGFQVRAPMAYSLDRKMQIVFAPWFAYSEIGQGETFTLTKNGKPFGSGYEPSSRTFQYGSVAGINFAI